MYDAENESDKFYSLGLSCDRRKRKNTARERAFYYLKLAADQGYIEAQYLVGYCYQMAYGTEKILQEAVKYYKLAADVGFKKAQYALAECLRKGGKNIEESWKQALYYYKLAANQGHLEAIQFLFKTYHSGEQVEQSDEQALYYLKLGQKLQDPECFYQLGRYYQEGRGNLNVSFFEALKCFKVAAAKGNKNAKSLLKSIDRILHPHAQPVDISNYLLNPQSSNLKTLLESYEGKPIFLNEYEFDWEETQVICEAMIENSHLTIIASDQCINKILLAFELRGYQTEKDLNYQVLTFSSHQPNLYGCVFIASKTEKRKN